MHRRRPPRCLSFCLAKRSEFRTAWPITSFRGFSTSAVWRIPYGGVLLLREGALGEDTRPGWSSWSHAPPIPHRRKLPPDIAITSFIRGECFVACQVDCQGRWHRWWRVTYCITLLWMSTLNEQLLPTKSWVQGPRSKWPSVGVRRLAVSSSGLVTTGKIGGRGFPPTTDYK